MQDIITRTHLTIAWLLLIGLHNLQGPILFLIIYFWRLTACGKWKCIALIRNAQRKERNPAANSNKDSCKCLQRHSHVWSLNSNAEVPCAWSQAHLKFLWDQDGTRQGCRNEVNRGSCSTKLKDQRLEWLFVL